MRSLLVVKVGCDDRPASQEDLDQIAEDIKEALSKGDQSVVLVTHHYVQFEQFHLPEHVETKVAS